MVCDGPHPYLADLHDFAANIRVLNNPKSVLAKHLQVDKIEKKTKGGRGEENAKKGVLEKRTDEASSAPLGDASTVQCWYRMPSQQTRVVVRERYIRETPCGFNDSVRGG